MKQKEKQRKSEKKRISVEEGLFTLPESTAENAQLIGSKCKFCGSVFFPKRLICGSCFKEGMETILLSNRGKITTWTVIWMSPPGFKGQVPYVLGEVGLPENVTIRTHFTGVDPNKPAIKLGDEVEMVIEKIYENEEGNQIVSYMFKPA